MKREQHRDTLLSVLLIGAVLLALEFYVRVNAVPQYVLPSPLKVISAFTAILPELLRHGYVTFLETILGMLIAAAFGVSVAIVMDAFPLVKSAVYPLLVVTQTVPAIVLAPIFIIYLGFGLAPKILTVVLMCFFPITVSFAGGMEHVDQRLVNLVRSYGASTTQVYTKVKIPAAAPQLFSGLKVAATYSISGAVVGEWLSSDSGLGYYMLRVKNAYMLDKVFACVLMVILLSLLMNGLVRLAGRALIRP